MDPALLFSSERTSKKRELFGDEYTDPGAAIDVELNLARTAAAERGREWLLMLGSASEAADMPALVWFMRITRVVEVAVLAVLVRSISDCPMTTACLLIDGGLGGGLGGREAIEVCFKGVSGRGGVGKKKPESWRSRESVVTDDGGGELNIRT